MTTTHVTLPFAGEDTVFHIGSRQIMQIEFAPSIYAGGPIGVSGRMAIGPLYARILRGRYSVDGEEVGIPAQAEWSAHDLDAVIFYGLCGGGKDEVDAADLMRSHVFQLPLMQRWDLAVAILGARFEGSSAGTSGG